MFYLLTYFYFCHTAPASFGRANCLVAAGVSNNLLYIKLIVDFVTARGSDGSIVFGIAAVLPSLFSLLTQ